MFNTIRAAAVNFVPWKWHKDWNADRLEVFFAEAAKHGAQLAVAPEGILEGYLVHEAFAWPQLREQMLDIAEPVDGPYVRRMAKLAKQLKCNLVFGFAELAGKNVYNTAAFIDARGRLRGTYRKMSNAIGHKTWAFNGVGKTIRAFDTPVGRVGMLICSDRWFPQIPRALVLDGAQLLCILTYGSLAKRQNRTVLVRARENGVPIVQANVGRNLIVSKGEIVALDNARNTVTLADVDIPAGPSDAARLAEQRQFLAAYPVKGAKTSMLNSARAANIRQASPHEGRPPRPARPTLRVRDHSG
jgi:predicted amidohydrolase